MTARETGAASGTATDAYVGIGANLGDRGTALQGAIDEMAALPGTSLLARSSIYESAPLDAGGGDYLNAVVHLATTLSAEALMHALQVIELAHGRVRSHRNAPRTLDLDLLLHGDTVLHGPELTLPHPRMHERAFVLMPLAEIAPRLRLPGGETAATALRRLGAQRISRWTAP